MTTSAQALNEIFAYISKNSNPKDRFLTAVASKLGAEDEDAEIVALSALVRIIKDIDDDIEKVDLGEREKAQLLSYMSPFRGISTFANIHLSLEHAKQNFLKPDHLVGLINVHMALAGFTRRHDLPDETKELAEKCREIAEDLLKSSMPERSKVTLAKLLMKVASAIENFNLFGSEALENEVETLLGAVLVNSDSAIDETEKDLLWRTMSVVSGVLVGLKIVDETFTVSVSLLETGKRFLNLIT